MAPYESSGSLNSSQKQISVSGGWDTQSEWSNYQIASNVDVSSGTVTLQQTSSVPDSGDLLARYDATEISASNGDSLVEWADLSGNGYHLTVGTQPTYRSSGINGNPSVEFDGSNQYLDVAWPSESQPNSIYAVARLTASQSSGNLYSTETGDGSRQDLFLSSGSWGMYAGNSIIDGSSDTNPHVLSSLFNTSNSTFRLDGAQTASGDVRSSEMSGFTVGCRYDQTNFVAVEFGEILIYPQDKSNIQTDVEQYLADKWGITL